MSVLHHRFPCDSHTVSPADREESLADLPLVGVQRMPGTGLPESRGSAPGLQELRSGLLLSPATPSFSFHNFPSFHRSHPKKGGFPQLSSSIITGFSVRILISRIVFPSGTACFSSLSKVSVFIPRSFLPVFCLSAFPGIDTIYEHPGFL